MKKIVKTGFVILALHQLVACAGSTTGNAFSSGAIYHQSGAVVAGDSPNLSYGDLLLDD